MAKLNEFLRTILEPTGVASTDLEMVLQASALKEIEVPEVANEKFNQYYLTRQRAENDQEIRNKIKKNVWQSIANSVDEKIINISLPEDFKAKLDGIPKDEANGIYKRLEIVNEALAHLKDSGSSEDVKKATEKFRQEKSELTRKISEYEEALKKKEQDFAQRETNIKLDYALRNKINSMNFGKEFAEHKDFLADSTINSLQKEFKLEFDKNDQKVIHLLNQDGTDYYGGTNKKITLDELLGKRLEKYLEKNTGGNNPPNPNPQPTAMTINNDKPLTLNDMIKQTAATA
jgi:hypothetical protein